MATQGQFATSFLGQPSVAPTLTSLMDAWIAEVENQSVLSEDNQGDNSPQALATECLMVAQSYIAALQAFSPPPPDAVIATATPYHTRILFEAGFVPAGQWNPATFNPNLPETIAAAVTAAVVATQNANTPPAPPPNPIRVGVCYGNVCSPGPGSSLANTVDGQIYTNPDGSKYLAHVTSMVGMTQLWFSPMPQGS